MPKKQAIVTVDGKDYLGEYLGKGTFSKVYRVGSRAVYYTRGDCAKEVMAMFQYDRMAHLPELIRHENVDTPRGMYYVFSSPFYRDVTKQDASAWILRKMIQKAYNAYDRGQPASYDKMQGFVDYLNEVGKPYRIGSIVKALQEIVDVSSNCGYRGIGFDFYNKNFGVNEYGTLIFRDPVYVRN